MKQFNILLIVFLACSINMFGQDSLWYGKTVEIEGVGCSSCVTLHDNWIEKEVEEHYSSYVDSIGYFITSNPQAKFQIRCYTDVRGIDSVNLQISQSRIDFWITSLAQRGVDTALIERMPLGELFVRKVWYDGSLYYIEKPKELDVREIDLYEAYIDSFKNDHDKFEYLHQLNRRTELVVYELDESAQRRVDYQLYLNELYGNEQEVEMIGPGTIENSDTIRVVNKGKLHLHLVAIGTENEFRIRSLERPDEEYYYHLFLGMEEKLLDVSSAKGLYEIECYGDNGSGKTFLFISN